LVLTRMMIETLAAEIMTLPLIVAEFSQLSLIGLLANLVIEPFVPVAMLVTMVAGLAGLWLPLWCEILATPAHWLLSFMLQLIGAMAALPWALQLVSLTITQMIECYVVMGVLTIGLVRFGKRR
jgi:competence protein ComEC